MIHATRNDMLRASTSAAAEVVVRASGAIAGALVLVCTGHKIKLGSDFLSEHAFIRKRVGAPIGGSCVCGEIARSARDVDAFFNTTALVVTFPR